MLNFLKEIEKTYIFLIKSVLFALLFASYFVVFLPEVPFFVDIPGLTALSRTAVISMFGFIILCVCFIRIYGGFPVGIKKSKDIIPSLAIAAFITDACTSIILYVMSVQILGKNIEAVFIPILAIFPVQLLIIIAFTRLGNFVFFKINEPKLCTVIYDDEEKIDAYVTKIGKYKKQWKVEAVVHYTNPEVKDYIRKNETVFLLDIPMELKSGLVEYCYKHSKNIFVTPDVSDVVIKHSTHILLDDVTAFGCTISGLSFEQKFMKRVVDIAISGIGLILSSPIMLVEALVIKLHDKGPIFFEQDRMTLDGKTFKLIKFRTMVVDAEKSGVAVLSSKGDKRITKVGKFLRATRLDELPQLINIFIGDMSFVGPRPERESIAKQYQKDLPEFHYRLKVKAGLTGLAQIMGKYNTTPKDKLTLDLVYIEQYSIWVDIKLLLQTLKVFFKSDSTEGFTRDDQVEFIKHKASDKEHSKTKK